MGISISKQAAEAAISLLLGAGIGIFYDLLGVFRYRLKLRIFTYVSDLIFGLSVGCAFFFIGIGPGEGQLRLFMLAFILAGCVVYFLLFSRFMSKLLGFIADFVEFVIRITLLPFVLSYKFIKKIKKKLKNLFKYLRKWFIIYSRLKQPLDNMQITQHNTHDKRGVKARKRKDFVNEETALRYNYENNRNGLNNLRGGKARKRSDKNKRSGTRARGT